VKEEKGNLKHSNHFQNKSIIYNTTKIQNEINNLKFHFQTQKATPNLKRNISSLSK
jgi:hypothetical protein